MFKVYDGPCVLAVPYSLSGRLYIEGEGQDGNKHQIRKAQCVFGTKVGSEKYIKPWKRL